MKDAYTIAVVLSGFVVLCLAWRQWKISMRDIVRDRLFELRDEWRNHYVENGLDMTDGAYAEIRDLINCMLRYTKQMRMIGYIYFAAHVDSRDVEESASRIASALGACGRKDTRDLAAQIRQQASEAVLLYMASTSLGFISTAVCMFVYLLPDRALSALKSCARSVFDVKPNTLECAVMR